MAAPSECNIAIVNITSSRTHVASRDCQYYELAHARGVSRHDEAVFFLATVPSAISRGSNGSDDTATQARQPGPHPGARSRRRRPGAGCCQRNGSDDTATQARQPGAPGAGKGRYALSTSDDDDEGAVPAPFVETKLVPWNRIPVGGQTDDPRATPSDRTWRAWGRLVKYSNGGKRLIGVPRSA